MWPLIKPAVRDKCAEFGDSFDEWQDGAGRATHTFEHSLRGAECRSAGRAGHRHRPDGVIPNEGDLLPIAAPHRIDAAFID